ncbi:MAG: phage Gp37/Gp68 family protein [Actinomycetota bacterium]
MADRSKIEWTEATWNPVTGCTKVSPGCDHCYAETFAERFRGVPDHPYEQGFDLRLWPSRLEQPLKWRRPRFVFVNSMSDLFHARVPKAFIARVFEVMAEAQQHTFQVLTKRPGRMLKVVRDVAPEPLPNVWLGTSIEADDHVARAQQLRCVPAAVRFLSLEPLLGPLPSLSFDGIDWVIVGGESGPGHRTMDPSWARDIRDACLDRGVPFFFKQWGGRTPKAGGRSLDGRTWDQMPTRETLRRCAADVAL